MDDNMLLNMALDAGEIMLSSGAETHRVEDTMERILLAGGNNLPEATALSTILIVSIHSPLSGSLTMTRKVPMRTINFHKICSVNALSRKFVAGKLTIEETYQRLLAIYKAPSFSPFQTVLAYGFASGAFSLMFLGNILDSIGALFTGFMLGIALHLLSKKKTPYFLNTLFGSIIVSIFAILFSRLGIGNHYDIVIVGSIMPLLPGVTITNAIRDIMEGNFLSGTSKVMEALLIAVAIAGGVGIVLSVYGSLFI